MKSTTEYIRECPVCGKTIYHTSKSNLTKLHRKKSPCRECFYESRKKYKEKNWARSCVSCGNETKFSTLASYRKSRDLGTYTCHGCLIRKNGPRDELTKKKISESKKGISRSEETKQKISLAARKRVADLFWSIKANPRVNPKGCSFIDLWGKNNGYNFQHGTNGGEVYFPDVGAWVDGYDSTKNVVFEYDEPRHYNIDGTLKRKDIRRMNNLISIVGCKVVRYNEKTNQISEYNEPL